jgi:hypothetical protein
MRHYEEADSGIDWKAWIALTWMFCFAVFYAAMLVKERAPQLLPRLTAQR